MQEQETVVKNEARATLKYVRISARKVKIVADLIRGKNVDEALAIVKYTPKASSEIIEKLLKSAIANAENNHDMKHENLYIAEIYANQGPTLKRIRPAAKGSAVRIRKRTSHITIVLEDQKIRKFLKKKLYLAGISKIEIERTAKNVKINLYTAKPGIVIGKGGAGVETVKAELVKLIGKDVNLNIVEVKNADIDAQLVAENIAGQLERRISFRRAMKQCMQKSMKAGALGIKTAVSGRLGGADMARTEFYKEGNIPLQTLRADIDYGFAEANTTYGKIGVKVWIYKGEVLPERPVEGGEK